MIDISVIVVNWNTKALLLDCIDSLYRTTKESTFETIVVDNASSDGSVEALRLHFPQVQVIVNPENFGFAKANNIGIQKAIGRYIFLVNSDVKALEGVLDNMCIFMDSRPDIGAIAPKTYCGDMRIQKNCREFPTLRNLFCQEFLLSKIFPNLAFFRGRDMLHCDYDTMMEIEVLSGCFLMVRREAIDQVGLLDERFFFYSEDVDWCKRIHDAGWKLMHYPGAEAIHYGHGSSSDAPVRFQVEMLKANWQYWKKHKSVFECALFWAIKFLGTLGRAGGWLAVFLFVPDKRPAARESVMAYVKMLSWLMSPRILTY
jgi:GT2 family glycosyltransferase